MRIHLVASALSTIDVDVFDGYDAEHDPPCLAVLRDCVDARGVLTVPDDVTSRRALIDAFDHLANTADDRSRERGVSKDERVFYARASKSLTTVAGRIRAAMRERACTACEIEGAQAHGHGREHTCR